MNFVKSTFTLRRTRTLATNAHTRTHEDAQTNIHITIDAQELSKHIDVHYKKASHAFWRHAHQGRKEYTNVRTNTYTHTYFTPVVQFVHVYS